MQETSDLTKKQQWYQQNQVSMLKDDEEDYVSYCTEAMFKIHILELRLQVCPANLTVYHQTCPILCRF